MNLLHPPTPLHDLPDLSALTLCCALLALLCLPAMAQESRPAAAPSPQRAAMDEETAALVAAIDRLRGAAALPATLVLEGTYEVRIAANPGDEPVARGAFRELFTDKAARHTSDMGSFGKLERGVTPDLAWEVDPALGAKRYDGPAGATVRRWFSVLRGESPAALYAKASRKGTARIGETDCVVLTMQPAAGKADTWYVDPKTGRVLRVEMALPSPDSAGATFDMEETIDARIDFGDWRQVGEASYPHRRELAMGPARVTLRCDKVAPGAAIRPEELAAPAAAAELQPAAKAKPVGAEGGPDYRIVDRQPQPVASIRVQCKPDEISATLAELLPEVMAHITATGGKIAGAPFSRYHAFGPEAVDLEAGIPVAEPIAEKGRVKNRELPGGKALTVWHIGPYDQLGEAHRALAAYASAKGIKAKGGVWEVYWTDPGMVPDSSKWRTQLFLPIAEDKKDE